MSKLTDTRAAYLAAQKDAERARVRFVREVRRERERGRTLAEIGGELGLTRQRVLRLAREK